MQINLQKSDVPIIWLDTFFVIAYGKITLGDKEDTRYELLYKILLEKIHEQKIFCARAEQEDELEDNIDICMKKFFSLTRGFNFRLSSEVNKAQSTRMMEVYHNGRKSFNVFQKDVLRESKNRAEGFIINVYSTPTKDSLINKRIEKDNNLKELQDFKGIQSLEQNFEEILENEYKGEYIATNSLLKQAENLRKMHSGKSDFDMKLNNQFMGLIFEPLQQWYQVTGQDNDIKGYLEFLLSEEHKKIPYIDISTYLIADIMSSPKKWDLGDSKDISNLSSYLPYCDFILTDKAQHNRIKRYGLDKKYDTAVYCMKNINDLIETIRLL